MAGADLTASGSGGRRGGHRPGGRAPGTGPNAQTSKRYGTFGKDGRRRQQAPAAVAPPAPPAPLPQQAGEALGVPQNVQVHQPQQAQVPVPNLPPHDLLRFLELQWVHGYIEELNGYAVAARLEMRNPEGYLAALDRTINGYVDQANELTAELVRAGVQVPPVPAGIRGLFN